MPSWESSIHVHKLTLQELELPMPTSAAATRLTITPTQGGTVKMDTDLIGRKIKGSVAAQTAAKCGHINVGVG